jgi:hypothetical protein
MSAELTTELSNAIRGLLEDRGDRVGIKTGDCVSFKKSHKNCEGCQYELGCSKLVRIMLTTFAPNMQNELIDKILAAKTAKEVNTIPIPMQDFSD